MDIAKKLKNVMEVVWNVAPTNMTETKIGEVDWFGCYVIYDMTHCVTLEYKYIIDNFQTKRLQELMGDKEVITLIQPSSLIHNCISAYMTVRVYYKQ